MSQESGQGTLLHEADHWMQIANGDPGLVGRGLSAEEIDTVIRAVRERYYEDPAHALSAEHELLEGYVLEVLQFGKIP